MFTVPDHDQLTTRQVTDYTRWTRKLKDPLTKSFDDSGVPALETWITSAKAAAKAGWLGDGVTDLDIELLKPVDVGNLGRKILVTYNKLQELAMIDPN